MVHRKNHFYDAINKINKETDDQYVTFTNLYMEVKKALSLNPILKIKNISSNYIEMQKSNKILSSIIEETKKMQKSLSD
jgi:hypothetical protein